MKNSYRPNASIFRDLATAVARISPEAHVLVISNPVNSTVPIVSTVFEEAGVYDPRRIFGVTTLDVVRASRFVSGIVGTNLVDTPIAVIGGHSGATIIPLLSQSSPGKGISGEAYNEVVNRIQYGSGVKAKDGAGSATLSMAYAGAKFTNALLRGLADEKGAITPTLSRVRCLLSRALTSSHLMSRLAWVQRSLIHRDLANMTPPQLNGVEKIHPIGELTAEEKKLVEACLPELKKNVEKGKAFDVRM